MPGLVDHVKGFRCLVATVTFALSVALWAQTATKAWSERETRLANEYLSLLVQQPEYGRVLELLWTLYEKHDATILLLDNVTQQAAASKHPSVLLVHGHLLRRSDDLKAAAAKYDEVLKAEATNAFALRSRADVALEMKEPEVALSLLKKLAEASREGAGGIWLEIGNLALGSGKNAEAASAWEKAAQLQVLALSTGRPLALVPEPVAALAGRQWNDYPTRFSELHFQALKDILARDEPDYAT